MGDCTQHTNPTWARGQNTHNIFMLSERISFENTVSFLKLQSMEIKIICPLHLPRVTLVNAISLITTGKDSTTAFCAGFHCDLVTGV